MQSLRTMVRQGVQQAGGPRGEEARQRLPIHLRGRTSGERCRVHERPAEDWGGQAVSADKLRAPLIGRGAYHGPPAVHTRVKRDDKDERLRRIAGQERSVQELGTTGQRGCPASPYRSIAMCMNSNAVCARSDIRTFMSQSNSSSFSMGPRPGPRRFRDRA